MLAGHEKKVYFTYYHCCNSAGIIDCKEDNLNLVRAGISTSGMSPSLRKFIRKTLR